MTEQPLLLFSDERVDEVNDRLRLIQKTSGLTFGTDALLLAAFIGKEKKSALELGGGSGIISMLLAARNRFAHITCAEIQEDYAALIERNVALNGLSNVIRVCAADVRETEKLGECGSFDAVFSNPPYMTAQSGKPCDRDAKNIARHELFGSIYDFAACASKMLKYGGLFYTVYRPDRLVDLLDACRTNGLEPKRITFVHARKDMPPSMVLTEAKRGGKPSLKVTAPLILSYEGKNSENYDYLLENGILPKDFF